MLSEMADVGVFRLLLTGGEVLVHKEFFDILEEARRLGFSVTVFTNGTLLEPDQIDRLAALFPHRVELSLYSHLPENHDAVTRLPGSFAKTVQAATQLLERGVTVALKMVPMRGTAADIDGFRALCASLGCEAQVDLNMSAGLDGARQPIQSLLVDPETLIRQAFDPRSALFVGTSEAPNKRTLESRSAPVCGAGRTTLSITPEGNVYPCNGLPLHVGSIRNEGLRSIWRQSRGGRSEAPEDPADFSAAPVAGDSRLSKWQDVRMSDFRVCGTLDRCSWCHLCPGMALLESGDELNPSLVNCRNAAARMVAHSLQTQGHSQADLTRELVETARRQFPRETALWGDARQSSERISLETVRRALSERGRIAVLR